VAVARRLDEEPDVSVRRALVLCLGEVGAERLPAGVRRAVAGKAQEIYRAADDPGLRAAAEWLLRHWGQDRLIGQADEARMKDKESGARRVESIRRELASGLARPQWYVNGQGQTMVVIPGPMEFLMGSPPGEGKRRENEVQHRRRIDRTFAISAKGVTVGDYLRFAKSYPHHTTKRHAPTTDCPVVAQSWYQAAAYCNWLSEQEGCPKDQWCYEAAPEGRVVRLKEGYLKLTGYRLPTEAEMEVATRAGAATSRCFGASEELLDKYAWFLLNAGDRSWPVGSKKPNDYGLFDVHGNVWCWCQEEWKPYPQAEGGAAVRDAEDDLSINSQAERVLRGGSFYDPASDVRSAFRSSDVPTNHYYRVGFRVARTFSVK
jgi:formylglycine-generating enzyme required for sulfatase activity